MPLQPPGYFGSLLLFPGTPRRDGIRERRRFQGVPLPCSSPDNRWKGIIPNQWGYAHNPWASNIPSSHVERRDPGMLNLFSWLQNLLLWQPEAASWAAGKTGLALSWVPSLPDCDDCVLLPYGVRDPLLLSLQGLALFLSTSCSHSWRCPASCLLFFSVADASGQKPQSEQSRLWLSWGTTHPPTPMCLVSSVTALKTNIFAYFAYFTNRECWLLIRYSSGVKVGVFN